MQDEELDFNDLFTVEEIDEEIRDFDNIPSVYELQRKINDLEALLKDKNQQIKLLEQQIKHKRRSHSASQEIYTIIRNLVQIGLKRKEIVGKEIELKDASKVKVTGKMFSLAMYSKNKGGK